MDYRSGKCSQCGAEYKVPASFQHNAARCKVCKGVVHLSAARAAEGPAATSSAAPSAIPAKKVVPKPAAPRVARPTPTPPTPPAPRPSEPQRPARGPEAMPRPAAAMGGTLERLKEDRAVPADAEPAAGGTERSPARRGRTEGAEGARGARRGRAEGEKKKPPMAAILSAVGLVVIVAVGYLFRESLFGSSKPAEASPVAATPAAPEPVAPEASEPSDPGASAATPAEPEKEAPKAEKAPPPPKDPSSVDLAAIPDFGPTPDTTPEEWTQMNEWGALWMDVEAGAAGNRAKIELLKLGRKAVPVILNQFKKLDFATKEGRSNGDQCQKAMQTVTNGRNFDWRYPDEAAGRGYDNPDDVYFNKRVVEEWVKQWRGVEENIEAWILLAKLEEKDPAEAARLRQTFGSPAPEGEDSEDDDLDVD